MPPNAESPAALPDVVFRPGRRVSEGIEWIDFGAVPKRSNLLLRPELRHRVRFSSLALVTGPCRHEVDFEPISLDEGDVLLIHSGAAQAYLPDAPLQAVGFVFSDAAAAALAPHLPVAPCFALRTTARRGMRLHPRSEDHACALRAVELLRGAVAAGSTPHAVRLLAAHVLTLCRPVPAAPVRDGGRTDPAAARDAERFVQFVRRVESDPARARSVSRHAEALGMSPGRLNLLVKRRTGLTAKTWIDRAVLLEAQRRLATESCSIEAVAVELGFPEATHFVKFFARLSGMTPGAFRRMSSGRSD